MLHALRSHLTYANVMASVAVFIAMGGGAYALSLPKNSVGAGQIKRNAVGASEIRSRAVGSSEVKNGSLLPADFKPGQLPAGPQGPPGPQGAAGPGGAAGGDLTGSYPNPSIAAGAVDGGNVADDSLTAADVDESTLGAVPEAGNAGQLGGIEPTGFGTGALLGRVSALDASGPSTQYGAISGLSPATTTESDVLFISTQSPMTVRELRVFVPGGMPAATSRTFTLRVNSADSALSCTVEAATFGCFNTIDTATMGLASGLTLRVDTNNSPGTQSAAFSMRVTTPP